jgi:hypothetical protein
MSIGAPYRNDINVEEYNTTVMAADLTLQLEDADVMVLDPGGVQPRNVTLPTAAMGAKVTIVNSADANENLTVLDPGGGSTNGIVGQNEIGVFFSDGTGWHHLTGVA